jgi:ClpX C4-type zinc finger protein
MIGVAGRGVFGRGESRRRCSFCGRRDEAVEHLVRARGVYICDRCVAQAQDAIAAASPAQRLLRIRPAAARLPDRDAAEQAIERAFETAFGSELPVAERCGAIERGANLTSTMEEVSERYELARDVDVSVEYVRFLSDDEAEVTSSCSCRSPGRPAFLGPGTRYGSATTGRSPATRGAASSPWSASNARPRWTDGRGAFRRGCRRGPTGRPPNH